MEDEDIHIARRVKGDLELCQREYSIFAAAAPVKNEMRSPRPRKVPLHKQRMFASEYVAVTVSSTIKPVLDVLTGQIPWHNYIQFKKMRKQQVAPLPSQPDLAPTAESFPVQSQSADTAMGLDRQHSAKSPRVAMRGGNDSPV